MKFTRFMDNKRLELRVRADAGEMHAMAYRKLTSKQWRDKRFIETIFIKMQRSLEVLFHETNPP